MKKLVKTIFLLLVLALISGIALAGCSNAGKEEGSQVGSADANTSSAASAQTEAVEETVDLSIIMSDSGVTMPSGFDPNDNPYINIVKKYANVNLKVEMPPYADFQTRLQLVLASGNRPDIIHTTGTWAGTPTYNAAQEGAFIDLRSYYDNSPVVQKYITGEMMAYAAKGFDKSYYIPGSNVTTPKGRGSLARYDLLVKYNNGVWPGSIDEWVAFAREVKKNIPEALIFTGRTSGSTLFGFGSDAFFTWHGVAPVSGYQVRDQKIVNIFTLPEYREAVQLYGSLFKEGLLDQEFSSSDPARYSKAITTQNVILAANTPDQYAPGAPGGMEWVFAPDLETYPASLKDKKYTYGFSGGDVTGHGMYISTSCKNPDRAWKVIEGFFSDELFEEINWGKEGEEYVVNNEGKRIVDSTKLNSAERRPGIAYACMMGFSSGLEAKKAVQLQISGTDVFNRYYDSVKTIADHAGEAGVQLWSGYTPIDDVQKKRGDADAFISEATAKAIMGQITMEEFDKRVQEWKEKYGFICDAVTQQLMGNKDKIREMGIKCIDW